MNLSVKTLQRAGYLLIAKLIMDLAVIPVQAPLSGADMLA